MENGLLNYQIEYSADGINFANGGSVPAKNQSVNNYQFTLYNFTQPVYYIRIRSVSVIGLSKYSSVIVITLNSDSKKLMSVTPNPVRDKMSVHIISDIAALADISIINTDGQVLYKYRQQLVKGENTIYVKDLSSAAPGVYMVRANIGTEKLTQKIVIIR